MISEERYVACSPDSLQLCIGCRVSLVYSLVLIVDCFRARNAVWNIISANWFCKNAESLVEQTRQFAFSSDKLLLITQREY